MEIEGRLAALGFEIPDLPMRGGNYVPVRRTGNLLYTSGNGPIRGGETMYKGKLGRDLTVDEGYKAAQIAAVNCLAAIKASIGDLDKVRAIIKVQGFVNSAPDFTDQPKVLNGASDLLVAAFGDKGRHARCAVGMASLPRDIAVEVEMIAEVED